MARAAKITTALADLERLDRAALAARWGAVIGRPAPKASSRVFLLRALSYELQSQYDAGLSKRDVKGLKASLGKAPHLSMGDRAGRNGNGLESVDRGASSIVKSKAETKLKRKPPARLALVPGARLVREWNGKAYTVSVIKEGFVYQDRIWSSLSAIAKDIQ